jgi:hypothetical protein
MIAIYSADLHDKKSKPEPDLLYVVEVENRMEELARERRSLHVTDNEKIATIRLEYGAQIRAHHTSDTNWDRA